MRSSRRHRRLPPVWAVCLGLLSVAGVGLVGPAPAAADPRGDARDASRAADRAAAILEDATVQAREAARRLETANAALPAAQHRVATAIGVVAAARAEAATARREADAARAVYDQIAARYSSAQDRVEAARDRVDRVATASYMGADMGALNVLVGATGPRDVMDRMGLIDQVMRKQQDTVTEMTVARRVARIEQDKAGAARQAAEDAEREAAEKLATAQAAQRAAVEARATVLRLAETRRQALAVAESQRAAVLARYQAARLSEQRMVAALQAWERRQAVSTPTIRPGARLLMPVRGWKSSDFGQRFDPYYRVWQLHAGMDIAAGGGTPIHAAADGRVIRAGWSGGYGRYTCISHGGRFTTCYAHQSRIGVHVGEYVRRGEVIGRVGTTGASTGYHLHFETRVNGVPKNPEKYLPSCLC